MSDSREDELERIRRTYHGYTAMGRAHLWDRRNRGYARMTRDRNRALAAHLRAGLETGPRLLDVGCGRGDLAGLLAQAGLRADLTGIDLIERHIADARSAFPEPKWIVGAADALPFDDGSFDVVMLGTLFSSIPGRDMQSRAASEIARVLAQRGSIIWYDLRYDNPWNHAIKGVGRRDVEALFPGWHIDLRPMSLLPPLARRLGPLTGVMYPVLHTMPALRSHLIGRIRRP